MKKHDEAQLMIALRRPFDPTKISFKPQVTTKDGKRAMAVAYADVRVYQDRLDEIAAAWSVTFTPWGDRRCICHLTIQGVTRSSIGEFDAHDERNEFAGTAAEAQAFKRAAAMFGIGRYLYGLKSDWVEYNKQDGFAPAVIARLTAKLNAHYQAWMKANPQEPSGAAEIDDETEAADVAAERLSDAPTASTSDEDADKLVAAELADLRETMNLLGSGYYGADWPTTRAKNIKRLTHNRTSDEAQLTIVELETLIAGLRRLHEKKEHEQLQKQAAADVAAQRDFTAEAELTISRHRLDTLKKAEEWAAGAGLRSNFFAAQTTAQKLQKKLFGLRTDLSTTEKRELIKSFVAYCLEQPAEQTQAQLVAA